jgi:hypothetical protein
MARLFYLWCVKVFEEASETIAFLRGQDCAGLIALVSIEQQLRDGIVEYTVKSGFWGWHGACDRDGRSFNSTFFQRA